MNPRILAGIVIALGACILGVGIYFAFKSTPPAEMVAANSVPVISGSPPLVTTPTCVIRYPTGSCWTIQSPPTSKPVILPSDPSYATPRVSVDGDTCTFIVPATDESGVRGCPIKKGQSFEITSEYTVLFSTDHPRVDANGMNGWYDPGVDSPFTQNVGGLEFSIGSLSSNRHFAGVHFRGVAEVGGDLIFRIIERKVGYHDNNSGGFKVRVVKTTGGSE